MMKTQLLIPGALTLALAACATADNTDAAETIYQVVSGHWTSESVTQYSAHREASEPYIHDWCLEPDEVTISASELAEALAGFVAENRGTCRIGNVDDQPYTLRFQLSCTLDDVDVAGEGIMTYARDGRTTDMTLDLNSIAGQPPASFSRTAHQEFLGEACPPGVD